MKRLIIILMMCCYCSLFAPDAWRDEKYSKAGYEITLTRKGYNYVVPRKSEDIYAHLKELNAQEGVLMTKFMGR